MLKGAAAVLALASVAVVSPFSPHARADPPRPAVLIGVPGLQWSDLSPSATPNLWRFAARGAAGLLSVRTVGRLTCPADGWVTVSAGARSQAGAYCERPVSVTREGAGAVVGDMATIRRQNAGFGVVGLLGDAVHKAGGCVAAVGPGAALAAADSSGRVDRYSPTQPGDLGGCPVTLVDAGAITGADRAAEVRRADATVGAALAGLPPSAAVTVAGVSDHDFTPHLRVVLTSDSRGHYLGSASTRRAQMTILPDLTATLLREAGVPPPAGLIGKPIKPDAERPASVDATVRDLSAQDVAAQTHRWLLPRFFAGFVIGQVLFYGAAAVALRWSGAPTARRWSGGPPARRWSGAPTARRRRWDGSARRRILAATRLAALAAAAVPVATYLSNLVPWWRTPDPALWLGVAIAAAAACVTALAVCGPWRRGLLGPGTLIAGVTAAVLCGDLLTGAHLQMNSVMGYSPLVGGRYYGIGNIAFAVLATSTLLAAAGAAHWLHDRGAGRAAVPVVLAMTLTAAVLDSWTAWGSDFGGLIAFVPGLATTALLVGGRRVSFWRLQLLRATGLVIVLGVAYLDHLRPPSQQTHMGRFFGQLAQGHALPWIERKFVAMLHTFTNLTLLPIVVAAFLFVLLVLYRPGRAGTGGLQVAYERAPMLRAGLSGAFVTALVGAAVNDSGIAIPALSLAVAVPLALAASVSAVSAVQTGEGPARTHAGGAQDEHPAGADEPRAGGAEDEPRAGGADDEPRAGGAQDQSGGVALRPAEG